MALHYLAAHTSIAFFTFSRPPVTVMPAREETGVTLLRRRVFSAAVPIGHAESTSAAAPDTCGVAIDVPLYDA